MQREGTEGRRRQPDWGENNEGTSQKDKSRQARGSAGSRGSRSASKGRYNQSGNGGSLGEERKAQLLKVFQCYTSFGERTNLKLLRSNKFHKMASDCGIPVDKTTLDLLFVSENKHRPNMTFDTFLDLLVRLATIVYPDMDLRKSTDTLIEKYYIPLYKTIMKDTIAGDVSEIVNKEVEQAELRPFLGAESTLVQVYEECFGDEFYKEGDFSNIEKLKILSEKAYFEFCLHFGIIPQYLERGLASSILEEILNKPLDSIQQELQFDPELEHGFIFTYSRFLYFLVVVGRISLLRLYKNSLADTITQEEASALLLSNIQSSPGFKATQQKRSVSHGRNGLCSASSYHELARSSIQRSTSKGTSATKFFTNPNASSAFATSSLRSRENVHEERVQEENGNGSYPVEAATMTSLRQTCQQTKRLRSLSKNKRLNENLGYKEDALVVFEKYSEPLNQLFSLYASMGEPLNTSKLKSIKFHKLLKDAGVMSPPNALSCKPNSNHHSAKSIGISRVSNTPNKHIQGQLTAVEADLIFVQLTGVKFRHEANNNSTWGLKKHIRSPNLNTPSHLSQSSLINRVVEGKLEFETFLKSLELIASKLYPGVPLSKAVEDLIVTKLLNLLSSVDYEEKVTGLHQIAKLKEILANPEYVRILGQVHDNISVYFNFYADSKQHMNFDSYVRFFKDFDIFPRFMSKSKLANYFYTLASLNDFITDNEGHIDMKYAAIEQTDKEVLDSHLFVEALAMVAIDISPSTYTFPEAFIFGLQRLDSSAGRTVIQSKLGLTRGANGFNWSLLRGLEVERQQVMFDVLNQEARKSRPTLGSAHVSFEQVYNL